MNSLAVILIIVGLVVLFAGLFLAGKTGPVGHLPGDITIQTEGSTVYIPIGTMILVSVVISVLFWIFSK